ncbi:MAG: aminopeptidase [Chitinophagales bacterium]
MASEEKVRNAWEKFNDQERKELQAINTEYLDFLNRVKTEREAINYIEEKLLAAKYSPLEKVKNLKPGQKVYFKYKNKVAIAGVIGKNPIEEGCNIVASHIDVPRIDLKPNPLYEDSGLALFKTHYYGGIKKYQWPSIPLALHGVVVKRDGQTINLSIGMQEEDPVFIITDLLIHLAKDQMERKLSEGVTAESLNILVGSLPIKQGKVKEKIKAAIKKILQTEYGIEEDDFASAELEAVPALVAKEVGFDRSLIGGYGQDDRVCAFLSLKALLETKNPQRTALCIFADKEEVGSKGNTGLQSSLLENLIADLMDKSGGCEYYRVMKALRSSYALSADVNGALDPNYESAFDRMNASIIGEGVAINKYTGSRGKSDASDANPEYVARILRLFDDNRAPWQATEMGKVDQGGGGTVAQFLSRYGMEVLDCGVALLGMHSPYEVASKSDIYASFVAYRAFMQKFI